MASTRAVWGIDIGRCALKAIKLRIGAEGKVEIAGFDYVEHAKILSQPDADRHELITSALEQFLSRNDVSKDEVVVSVPGQHTLARFSKLPPVAPKRIPDIVRYEADQQIPFDMDEVIWDYQTFQEEGLPDIEVGIFAMKRELIREHLLHFEQASIEPVGVQSGPLAMYNAALFDGWMNKETTILLDIGAEGTDLVIGTPTRLWTRAIPIGGNNLTDALVKAFKLSFAKAESLKKSAASSKYARQTFQAMRPVFADLVQELQRSLGFYSSTHRDAKVETVIGVGDAFLLPGLQKYMQQNLGLSVELPEMYRNATTAEGVNAAALKEHILGSWVAYGLALQGLEQTKVTSNLLPTEIAKQVVWRKKRPAFAAAAACLVLAGGLIWFKKSADLRVLASGSDVSGNTKLDQQRAAEIIDNGPPSSLSDRAKTTMVLEAGNVMTAALKSLSGKGEKERIEAQKLLEFQRNQTLVPKVVRILHEAIPRPEGPLARAGTPRQALEALAGVPRGERKQVFIETLLMDYVPDLNAPPWPKSLIDTEKPLHNFEAGGVGGFLVKLQVSTPNQNGLDFVKKNFVDVLKAKGRVEGLGFHLDRVHIVKGEKLDAAKGASAGGRRPPGGAAARPSPTGGGTGAAPLIDPLTDEPLDDDWRFDVWVDVILGDFQGSDGSDARDGAKSGSNRD